MTEENPHFMRKIASAIMEELEIPMWRTAPDFSWEEFNKKLRELFHREIHAELSSANWKSKDLLLSSMGENPRFLAIEAMPLNESLYLLMSLEDLKRLSSWFVNEKEKPIGFTSVSMQQGFLRFFCLTVLSIIDEIPFVNDLSFHVCDGSLAQIDHAYALDISLNIPQDSIWCRLLLPPSFQNSFKNHYINKPLHLSPQQQSAIELDLSLIAGQTRLQQSDLQALKPGDFILLDHCWLNPETKKGTLLLTYRDLALFQTKFKENGIKILDYANYREAHMSDEFSDEELSDTPDEQLHSDKIFDENDHEVPDEHGSEKGQDADASDHENAQEIPPEELVSLQKIPVDVQVEVANIRMTMDKLLSLSPGNMLDLNIHPEQNAYLVVNGKRIGRGQLMQIGETLGIKIVKIGS